ncbi:MAG: hypothetical protein ACREHF_12655 [Rhizomicrobium sp.]
MKPTPPNGRTAPAANPEPKRPKTSSAHAHDGLAAALRADPEALRTTRTRTALGEMVRQLAVRAAAGQSDTIRIVLSMLAAQAETQQNETGTYADPQGIPGANAASQGISEHDTRWDWTADGVWDSARHLDPGSAEAETPQPDADAGPPWEMLYARFLRDAEAERVEAARKAGLRSGTVAPPDLPASGSFSGNSAADPAPAPAPIFSVRIAGKEV